MFKKSSKVALITLASRTLGFARDILLAYFLGATLALDTFLIAFKLPNLFRRIYAEGAISQAIIPHIQQEDSDADLLGKLVGSLGILALVLVLLIIVFSPVVISLIAPGYGSQPHKLLLSSELLRWIAPFLVFTILTGVYAAFLNTKGQFGLPAFMPALLNLALISVLIIQGQNKQITSWLAMTISLVGLMQLCILMRFTYRVVAWYKPKIALTHPMLKAILIGLLPTVIVVSVIYIGFFVDTLFASMLTTGSISWLYYSERLVIFPISIVGSAIAIVLLPQFKQSENNLKQALAAGLMLGIPSALGLYILSQEIISALFFHGAFSKQDMLMTSQCLQAFSVGIPAFIAIKILAVHYFANKKIIYPFICACIAISVNILLNLYWVNSLGHTGLALATSIAGWLNIILLYGHYALKHNKQTLNDMSWMIKCLSMNGLFAGYLYLSYIWAPTIIDNLYGQLILIIFSAMLVYAILWWLFNFKNDESKTSKRLS